MQRWESTDVECACLSLLASTAATPAARARLALPFPSTPAAAGADEAEWMTHWLRSAAQPAHFSLDFVMVKKLCALALVVVAGGCRMCSDCCDYSSPVPGGQPMGLTRAGSVLSGGAFAAPYYQPASTGAPVPMPAVDEVSPPPVDPVIQMPRSVAP